MESPLALPELPQNAELLGFVRQQASRPAGSDDYTLGSWQPHTHPDLLSPLTRADSLRILRALVAAALRYAGNLA